MFYPNTLCVSSRRLSVLPKRSQYTGVLSHNFSTRRANATLNSGPTARTAVSVSWHTLGLRFASTKTQYMRGRPVDLNILEPSLPVPFDKRPWFYTQEGRKYWKKRLIVTIRSTFCAFQVRKAFPDFGLSFARNVQGIYIEMNEAFARGDRKALEELVTDTMLTKLNPDLKAASNLGRYEWKAHGELSRPRILTIAAAKVQMEKGGEEHKLVQITVEVNVKQSVALYDRKNALIGGNPNDIKNITEYIVVQRSIGKEGDERGWQIAGKITAPSS